MSILIQAEDAIIARLRDGLGKMVSEVGGYAGELDDGLGDAIRRFPAAWVTFGGIEKTEPENTRRSKWRAHGKFVVMVGQRNVRSEAAARKGDVREIGAGSLVWAVRRLLTGQDMGLCIARLTPARVRTLYNTRMNGQAFSVFACEFSTSWTEEALDGLWPSPQAPDEPDAIFARYGGQVVDPAPELLSLGINYHLSPDDGEPDAQDVINLT